MSVATTHIATGHGGKNGSLWQREVARFEAFDLSDGTVPTKLHGGNLYTNTVAFEQQEAAKRSPEADSKLFHATCDELHKLFDVIVTLKEEGAASEEVQ
ncbi:hypothetical protein pipiens_006168 [Culex pipiens pipiens]|uniref:Uncharacterized protein n=1 Tax=Culex pipiens pipiens TaxID=38569 RepID=A0ABD1DR79_CULPP